MDSPYHATVLDVDSVKDCGSTYGLFAGIALALMKMRLGAGLIRWSAFLAIELNRLLHPGLTSRHPLPLQ